YPRRCTNQRTHLAARSGEGAAAAEKLSAEGSEMPAARYRRCLATARRCPQTFPAKTSVFLKAATGTCAPRWATGWRSWNGRPSWMRSRSMGTQARAGDVPRAVPLLRIVFPDLCVEHGLPAEGALINNPIHQRVGFLAAGFLR